MTINEPVNDKSTGIMFKREITPGNLVSWALVLGGFVYGYSTLNGKVDAQTIAIVDLKTAVGKMEGTDAQLQAQINVLRDLSTTRQIDISTKMTRLETILERMEGKVDSRLTKEDKRN